MNYTKTHILEINDGRAQFSPGFFIIDVSALHGEDIGTNQQTKKNTNAEFLEL